MIMKKLLMLTAIITGFSFISDSGNCTDNSAKKPIFRVVYDNERNEKNNNNNNVNDVRRPTLERNDNNNNNVNDVRRSTLERNENNNNNNVNDVRRSTLERNENSNNNNVNNVRGSTFMITDYRREPMFIVTRYDDDQSSSSDDYSYSESTNYHSDNSRQY